MEPNEEGRLAEAAEEMAGTASRLLAGELTGGDYKRARDLAAIFKDMALLARELGGGGRETLCVRFEGETEAASG